MLSVQLGGHRAGSPIKGHMLIDDEDADLAQFRWSCGSSGYAYRGNPAGKTTCAHAIILARMLGRPLATDEIADHINGNKLDCRRANLRPTSRAGNAQNRTAQSRNNTSGYRGVSYHIRRGKWYASAGSAYGGAFDTAEAAAIAAFELRHRLGYLDRTQE